MVFEGADIPMTRVATMLVVLVAYVFLLSPAYADGDITPPPAPAVQIRYSSTPAKFRAVLDLPSEAKVTDDSSKLAAVANIAQPLTQKMSPIAISDPVVKEISVTADDNNQIVFTVSLLSPRKCQIFTVPATADKPFRVVIDVPKTYTIEEHRAISSAINYTRLERQTDTRYFVAHIIDVDAKIPQIRFAVVGAQGARETVTSMVTRNSAVCGINGGYFISETRPVGLLKINNEVRSLPIWQRAAVAFPKQGLPIFANPTGKWSVKLPDGSTKSMADWMDASRAQVTPDARVIPGASITRAPANPLGLTAIICAGKIIALPKDATPLEPGDFAIHLTGDAAKSLAAQLTLDATVSITADLTPGWENFPSAVGAGPRLLRNGALAIANESNTFQGDIINGRAARTALGVTKDGHVIMLVIEAPGIYGGGASLRELADLLKARGVRDAINLDGGGSSNLAIGAETVNYPPKTWLRPVACGVLVFEDPVQTARMGHGKAR